MKGKGRLEGHELTLHEESAEQLISGHGFDLCPQVDVATDHQRRPPEPKDPETGRKYARITDE